MRRVCALFGLLAASACGGDGDVPGRVTFNEHIAPIVYDRCVSCHRPGQVAPFSLLDYESARANAAEIGRAVERRYMPPWLPEGGDFALVGADRRQLTDVQIATIQRWIKQGSAEGDPAARPAPPVFPDGWELGTPDLVVATAEPYILQPDGDDVYRQLVLRTNLTEARWIRAVELQTNGAPIHHAVIRLDRTPGSRRRDRSDGQPGYEGMSWSATDPDGQFLGWAPGRGPIESPAGMAWRLEPGTDLAVEVHVIRGTRPQPVAPSIGLYFADSAPAQTPVNIRLGSKLMDIPAGGANYLVTDSWVMPFEVRVLSINPHAHYLGREFDAIATLPDGSVRSLLRIPRWDFHWQQDYQYETPIVLPAGTRVTMRWVYDNSTGNPFNPSVPPVRVMAGPASTDEMAELSLQVLTGGPDQDRRLLEELAARTIAEDIAMGEYRVGLDGENPEYRALLGGSYVLAGRFGEALPHLEAAVRLGDRTAATQSDLGVALLSLGRPAEALTHLRRATTLAPDDEVLHFNLGTALGGQARPADAERAFRTALEINPDYVDAHVNLGALLVSTGRAGAAVPHFQQVARLQPGSPQAHSNLAGALMAAGRPREALAAVRQALALDPAYAPARDTERRLAAMGIR